MRTPASRYRYWNWKRKDTKKQQALQHTPRYLYVVVRLIVGKEYGWWRGTERNHAFTRDINKACKFRTAKCAQTTADNSLLYKLADYKVCKINKTLLD